MSLLKKNLNILDLLGKFKIKLDLDKVKVIVT